MIHNGNTIYESLVTCEYIEDVFPGVKLHSEDPAQRAKDRMLVEVFNKVIMPLMRIWFGAKRGFAAEDRARQWTESMENLNLFERELKTRGADGFFSCEDRPGWLDYMVWPWFERFDAFFETYKVTKHFDHASTILNYSSSRNLESSFRGMSLPSCLAGWREC